MSGEIQIVSATGLTLYALVFNQSAQIWNTSSLAFESWTDGSIAHYIISMSEKGTSGVYAGNFPALSAAIYGVVIKQQAGGSPAANDSFLGSGDILWKGSAVFDLNADLVLANLSKIASNSTPVTNLANDYNGTGYDKPNSSVGPIDYVSGFVDDPSPTTLDVHGDLGLSSIDGFYIGSVLAFTSGILRGKAEKISGYVGSTRVLVFFSNFAVAPSDGDTFIILGRII